jgi:hypothetical protein
LDFRHHAIIRRRINEPSEVWMKTHLSVLPRKLSRTTLPPIQRTRPLNYSRPTSILLSPPLSTSSYRTFQPPHQQTPSPSTSTSHSSTQQSKTSKPSPPGSPNQCIHKPQSLAEQDAVHLAKMQEAMGGADHSNVEMEDGIPDRGMKRNVRENMFRII